MGWRLLAAGVLQDERFQDGGDLLLLAAWKLRSGIEQLPHLPGRRMAAKRLHFAEQFLDRDTERLGYRHQQIGARKLSCPFPETDVRRLFVHDPGQFPEGQPGFFPQGSQMAFLGCHGDSIRHD